MIDKYIGVILSFIVAAIISIIWVFVEDNYQKNKEDYDQSDWP
jgi:nucleoside recognition membrane protein YjiH